MNIILKGLTAVGLAVAVAGLTPAIAETPKKGGIFEYGVKAGIPTYDLQGSNSYGTLHRTEQHYSLLVTFDWKNFPKTYFNRKLLVFSFYFLFSIKKYSY